MTAAIRAHWTTPPPGWEQTVRRLGGTAFHSTEWADYQRHAGAADPVFLLYGDAGGEPRAGALAFLRAPRRPIASRLFRRLSLAAHPFGPGPDRALAGDVVTAIERWARARGCIRLGIGSFMSGDSAWSPAEGGYQESRRVEFLVDLTRDTAALWQAIKKDQRERIRRIRREGLIVEPGTTLEDVRGLRTARRTTQQKRGQRGQDYAVQADDAFYTGLYEHLLKLGAGRLFVARGGGEVLAALFFVTWNGQAYSVFSGSTDAAYRLGAQSGLYWLAVETFKAEGFTLLNRGGVPTSAAQEGDPLHGIYQFKLRLGTTPVPCRSGVKVLSPLRHWLASLGSRLGRREA